MLHPGQMGILAILLRIHIAGRISVDQGHKLLPHLAGGHRQPRQPLQRLPLKLRIHLRDGDPLPGPIRQALQQNLRPLPDPTRGQLLRVWASPLAFDLPDHFLLPGRPLAYWVVRSHGPRLH